MFIYWLSSRAGRQAWDSCKHVEKILSAQSDLLSPDAAAAVKGAISDVRDAVQAKATSDGIATKMSALETVANKWLRPYPNASIRDNVEVVLVAVAVALGIRTFFLQPFKIPTGSMQPTLFGITNDDYRRQPGMNIPSGFTRIIDSCLRGISYYHIVATEDGPVRSIEKPQTILPFVKRQRLVVGNEVYAVWFPPEDFERRSGLRYGQEFRKGDDIVKMRVVNGDHLFVDRISYNFRRPKRGEIIVFETRGIESLPQDQFYIKRLVALGGESVKIGNDRHLQINGQRLDSTAPHFEHVYSFDAKTPPDDSKYSGHVNDLIGRSNGRYSLAPLFPDESRTFTVQPTHYMVMGDNTMNSLDSRSWGDFPQENVIGKSFFVYWPILPKDQGMPMRFGWGVK